ncbi:MAG TPA: hypothetical protein VGK99_04060 [Acidobacteriota bacterium]|jgi:tetratricopeptide (TPR) repeat protein
MKQIFSALIVILCFATAVARPAQSSREDYDALMKILQAPADARIQMGEEFLTKYPQSSYVSNVHQQLAYAYHQKNPDKVIEHAEQARSIKDPSMLTFLASAYNDKKNEAKTIETAEAAIQLVNTSAKPADVTDEQWAAQKNALFSFNQQLMGMSYYRQAKAVKTPPDALLNKSKEALKASIAVGPKNDIAYYYLGLTLAEQSQGDAACEALAKAVAIEGPAKPYAQQDLEKIYMHYHKKSKVGLDKVLAKAKAEMK